MIYVNTLFLFQAIEQKHRAFYILNTIQDNLQKITIC